MPSVMPGDRPPDQSLPDLRFMLPLARQAEPARRLLEAGVPLTLLLDLLAGEELDSRAILRDEQVAAMVSGELARRHAEERQQRDESGHTGIA